MFSNAFIFIVSIFVQPDTENVSVNKPIPVVHIPEDEIVIEYIQPDSMMY